MLNWSVEPSTAGPCKPALPTPRALAGNVQFIDHVDQQAMRNSIPPHLQLNDKQLTSAIKNATTAERLAQLSQHSLNAIHIAAILTKLANISKVQPAHGALDQAPSAYALRSLQTRQLLVQQLVQMLKAQQCQGHCPRGLANIIWALGKLQSDPDLELLTMLLHKFCGQLSAAVPQDIANVLWGVAQITREHGPASDALLAGISPAEAAAGGVEAAAVAVVDSGGQQCLHQSQQHAQALDFGGLAQSACNRGTQQLAGTAAMLTHLAMQRKALKEFHVASVLRDAAYAQQQQQQQQRKPAAGLTPQPAGRWWEAPPPALPMAQTQPLLHQQLQDNQKLQQQVPASDSGHMVSATAGLLYPGASFSHAACIYSCYHNCLVILLPNLHPDHP
eukprot:gene9728-9887_t